jgi:hypothetical protein
MVVEILEVFRVTGDVQAIVDLCREPLVARIEHVDVVVIAQQIHQIDALGSIRRPARDEDERLAFTGFPVGEFHAIAGHELY